MTFQTSFLLFCPPSTVCFNFPTACSYLRICTHIQRFVAQSLKRIWTICTSGSQSLHSTWSFLVLFIYLVRTWRKIKLGIEFHVVSHLFFSVTQQAPTSEAGFSSQCQLTFSKQLWESFHTLAHERSVTVGYGQLDTIIYFIQFYNVPIG